MLNMDTNQDEADIQIIHSFNQQGVGTQWEQSTREKPKYFYRGKDHNGKKGRKKLLAFNPTNKKEILLCELQSNRKKVSKLGSASTKKTKSYLKFVIL